MVKTLNQPLAISQSEWQEIMLFPVIRELWMLTDETVEEFMNRVYGAKFNFQSGSPDYVGDLYILQGDEITGESPILLGRREGQLMLLQK